MINSKMIFYKKKNERKNNRRDILIKRSNLSVWVLRTNILSDFVHIESCILDIRRLGNEGIGVFNST